MSGVDGGNEVHAGESIQALVHHVAHPFAQVLDARLIVFSDFFSNSETSFFSLGRLDIEQMRRDDNPRIDLVELRLGEPRRLIVTILTGNELANV